VANSDSPAKAKSSMLRKLDDLDKAIKSIMGVPAVQSKENEYIDAENEDAKLKENEHKLSDATDQLRSLQRVAGIQQELGKIKPVAAPTPPAPVEGSAPASIPNPASPT